MSDREKNPEKVDVFLAGVIQGSQTGRLIESQDYRDRIKEIFARKAHGWTVYCPFENHSASVEYGDEEGRKVFLHHLALCRTARLLVAYLPFASLGTSIEIWEAHNAGVPVVAISPMNHNWVLRFFCKRIFVDLEAFENWLSLENLQELRLDPDSTR